MLPPRLCIALAQGGKSAPLVVPSCALHISVPQLDIPGPVPTQRHTTAHVVPVAGSFTAQCSSVTRALHFLHQRDFLTMPVQVREGDVLPAGQSSGIHFLLNHKALIAADFETLATSNPALPAGGDHASLGPWQTRDVYLQELFRAIDGDATLKGYTGKHPPSFMLPRSAFDRKDEHGVDIASWPEVTAALDMLATARQKPAQSSAPALNTGDDLGLAVAGSQKPMNERTPRSPASPRSSSPRLPAARAAAAKASPAVTTAATTHSSALQVVVQRVEKAGSHQQIPDSAYVRVSVQAGGEARFAKAGSTWGNAESIALPAEAQKDGTVLVSYFEQDGDQARSANIELSTLLGVPPAQLARLLQSGAAAPVHEVRANLGQGYVAVLEATLAGTAPNSPRSQESRPASAHSVASDGVAVKRPPSAASAHSVEREDVDAPARAHSAESRGSRAASVHGDRPQSAASHHPDQARPSTGHSHASATPSGKVHSQGSARAPSPATSEQQQQQRSADVPQAELASHPSGKQDHASEEDDYADEFGDADAEGKQSRGEEEEATLATHATSESEHKEPESPAGGEAGPGRPSAEQLNRAAAQIQGGWRGHVGEKRRRAKENEAAVVIQQNLKAAQQAKQARKQAALEAAAASQIQGAWRGYSQNPSLEKTALSEKSAMSAGGMSSAGSELGRGSPSALSESGHGSSPQGRASRVQLAPLALGEPGSPPASEQHKPSYSDTDGERGYAAIHHAGATPGAGLGSSGMFSGGEQSASDESPRSEAVAPPAERVKLSDVLKSLRAPLYQVFTFYAAATTGMGARREAESFDAIRKQGKQLRVAGWLRACRGLGLLPLLASRATAVKVFNEATGLSKSPSVGFTEFVHCIAVVCVRAFDPDAPLEGVDQRANLITNGDKAKFVIERVLGMGNAGLLLARLRTGATGTGAPIGQDTRQYDARSGTYGKDVGPEGSAAQRKSRSVRAVARAARYGNRASASIKLTASTTTPHGAGPHFNPSPVRLGLNASDAQTTRVARVLRRVRRGPERAWDEQLSDSTGSSCSSVSSSASVHSGEGAHLVRDVAAKLESGTDDLLLNVAQAQRAKARERATQRRENKRAMHSTAHPGATAAASTASMGYAAQFSRRSATSGAASAPDRSPSPAVAHLAAKQHGYTSSPGGVQPRGQLAGRSPGVSPQQAAADRQAKTVQANYKRFAAEERQAKRQQMAAVQQALQAARQQVQSLETEVAAAHQPNGARRARVQVEDARQGKPRHAHAGLFASPDARRQSGGLMSPVPAHLSPDHERRMWKQGQAGNGSQRFQAAAMKPAASGSPSRPRKLPSLTHSASPGYASGSSPGYEAGVAARETALARRAAEHAGVGNRARGGPSYRSAHGGSPGMYAADDMAVGAPRQQYRGSPAGPTHAGVAAQRSSQGYGQGAPRPGQYSQHTASQPELAGLARARPRQQQQQQQRGGGHQAGPAHLAPVQARRGW